MINLTFDKPLYLYLLLVIPLLLIGHYLFLARNQKKALRFANFVALKRIAGERFVTKNITVLLLRTFAILGLILALSQATLWYDGYRSDYDYAFAVDTSTSMLTEDLKPNRFALAKESAILFLEEVPADASFGLISFSGVTQVITPFTKDRFTINVQLNALNISRTGGTDLSNAIITATNTLSPSERGKAIIIFTDGSDTVSSSVDSSVKDAVAYALSKQAVIHTVGIGTNSAPVGYLPETFNLPARIDTDTLEYISSTTNGKSVFPKNIDELNDFFVNLASNETYGKIEYPLGRNSLLFAFILIGIEWILINLIFRRVA